MFICDGCIKDYVISGEISCLLQSRGRCESCHGSGTCYDVPHGRYYHKDSLYGRQLRFERGEKLQLRNAPELIDYIKNQIDDCGDVVKLRDILVELLAIATIYCKDFVVTVDKYRKVY